MMYCERISKAALAGCAATVLTVAASPVAADMERRYLALDPSMRAGGTTLNLVMGQATGNQQVVATDRQWELDANLRIGYLGGVTYNPQVDQYWMYYEIRQSGVSGNFTALAVSDDGINWTKPATGTRGPAGLRDHPESNFIHVDPHPNMINNERYGAGHAFYDEKDGNFKMSWVRGPIHVTSSANGLDFGPSQVAMNYKADTLHSFFYDTIRNEYVMYGRIRGTGTAATGGWPDGQTDRRGIPLHRNATWSGNWSNVGQVVIDPAEVWDYTTPPSPDGTGPDAYQPNIQMYHGQYIGLPAIYHRDGTRIPVNRPERTTGTGPIYPMVAHSLDGASWNFPDLEHSIVDLTPHERVNQWEFATNQTTAEVGQMYTGPNFIEKGDQLLIYYFYRDDTHYEGGNAENPNPYYDQQLDNTIHVAFMRRDGFASLKAEEGESGEWRTAGITVPTEAKGLEINANVDGSLRVEIWQPLPFPGTKMAESLEFTGDKISHLVRWDGLNFEDLVGQNVQFRFFVEHGEIYSFQFSPIPEPVSLVLMGMGSLALLRRSRRAA